MANNFGFEKNPSEYQVYRDSGRPVRVETLRSIHEGFVSNIGPEYLELNPSIVYENLPSVNGGMIYSARIETQIHKMVSYGTIQTINPLSDGSLEKIVESVNKIGESDSKNLAHSVSSNRGEKEEMK